MTEKLSQRVRRIWLACGVLPGGLKEADWVYTDSVPGAKVEILAQTPAPNGFPARRGISVRPH